MRDAISYMISRYLILYLMQIIALQLLFIAPMAYLGNIAPSEAALLSFVFTLGFFGATDVKPARVDGGNNDEQ